MKPKEFDPDTSVTPLGGDDLNGAMRPGQNPLTFDPDTHGYTIYTRNYDFAETNYSYDTHGNLSSVRLPAPSRSDTTRIWYSYDYEDVLNTHISRVTDAFSQSNIVDDYDFRYGVSRHGRDRNYQQSWTSYDNLGRLKFVEDGSGGTEYRYDAMDNVNRMRRTLSIPGEMVATANFEWRYDSFGKLLGMTYPAIRSAYGERVACRYDRSGQLQSVYTNNTEGYYYARDIGYDRFGSQIHMEYGNGASTDYAYIPTNRRLQNISVSTSGSSAFTFGRAYTYDRVGNILALTSSTGGTGTLFPPVSHEYRYDNLYRLVGSNGYTIDGGQMSAIDSLTMTYDDMYRITGKTLVMSQQNVQFDGTLSAGYTLGYNYNTATGRKFQMSSVTDVNYRVASASVSNSDKIDERHTYEYDRNGNITYAGTARKRGDRAYRDRTREEKFRWDEANRLLAISQDGYVSHYFYDASGERTVKMHGGNSAVFVNSQMSGRETGALSFSAYFNPYFSIHDGTRFTKHLYIGSERIASMTGELDEDYYDVANNNNIVHAGVEVNVNTNDLQIPYTDRCYAMCDSIDGNYSYFGLHSGLDWSGTQLRALSLPCHGEEDGSVSNGGGSKPRSQGSGTGNDYPSRYGSIWYFHKDHLGSSTLITNGDGFITQQIDYLPHGEVFLERQRNANDYLSPYRFNGKELDEETGLYYYGARYMNPRLSIWYATDPLQEKYPNITSYAYCAGNPVNSLDTDGNRILFVNGYWNSTKLGDYIGSKYPKQKYWGNGFATAAQNFFNDFSKISDVNYIDGSSKWGGDMSGKDRYDAGYKFAKKNYSSLVSGMKKGESFNIVTHSEGAAYGAGVAQYLIDRGYTVNTILHLSADESDEFTTPVEPYTLQLSSQGDWITNNHTIKNVDKVGEIVKGNLTWKNVHGVTKNSSVFKAASDLLTIRLQDIIGIIGNKSASWKSQVKGTTPNGTDFYRINGYEIRNEDGTKK